MVEFMEQFEIKTNSQEQTMNIANHLAKHLYIGDIVILTGDLGSGKTKFTEGFLSYFGLEDEISSPTFNIVNEYHTGAVSIFHFDVYRLADIEEFYEIGGEEYFAKGICLIEWGELIKDALPNEYLSILFKKDSENEQSRTLIFKAIGNKYENIIKLLKEDLS